MKIVNLGKKQKKMKEKRENVKKIFKSFVSFHIEYKSINTVGLHVELLSSLGFSFHCSYICVLLLF